MCITQFRDARLGLRIKVGGELCPAPPANSESELELSDGIEVFSLPRSDK